LLQLNQCDRTARTTPLTQALAPSRQPNFVTPGKESKIWSTGFDRPKNHSKVNEKRIVVYLDVLGFQNAISQPVDWNPNSITAPPWINCPIQLHSG
jgi:hypothetical protein